MVVEYKNLQRTCVITIHHIDKVAVTLHADMDQTADYLVTTACDYHGICNKDIFSLYYLENDFKYWIDKNKLLKDQKGINHRQWTVMLEIKYFPLYAEINQKNTETIGYIMEYIHRQINKIGVYVKKAKPCSLHNKCYLNALYICASFDEIEKNSMDLDGYIISLYNEIIEDKIRNTFIQNTKHYLAEIQCYDQYAVRKYVQLASKLRIYGEESSFKVLNYENEIRKLYVTAREIRVYNKNLIDYKIPFDNLRRLEMQKHRFSKIVRVFNQNVHHDQTVIYSHKYKLKDALQARHLYNYLNEYVDVSNYRRGAKRNINKIENFENAKARVECDRIETFAAKPSVILVEEPKYNHKIGLVESIDSVVNNKLPTGTYTYWRNSGFKFANLKRNDRKQLVSDMKLMPEAETQSLRDILEIPKTLEILELYEMYPETEETLFYDPYGSDICESEKISADVIHHKDIIHISNDTNRDPPESVKPKMIKSSITIQRDSIGHIPSTSKSPKSIKNDSFKNA
ncbi:hypothetical protein A3Q56_01652 [Intoshia linei]|uniref:FERM domain-containing protein n=1 Tax=Intoshia linei TaxID=1819745 RepID=A0A177BAV4_9BILA|nr:hypothetical protein A3Q56_01652 [Intoshia linei]